MAHLSIRLPATTIAKLDLLAAEHGTTRSQLVRGAIEGLVGGRPLPPSRPMDEEEIVALLVERAREGNVSALRTMLAREQSTDPHRRALEVLEQMATERRS
jgi:metal-responsive CopG/Arc/MetJ family transcriptional regulator